MGTSIPLKRELGLLEVTLSGIGIILGAGIYVLLGPAAALAGNALWIAFVLAATIAALTGLSYAELSSMFPTAGAEHDYAVQAFTLRVAFIVGMLVLFTGIISTATVALGFAGYFSVLTGSPYHLTAISLIALLSLIVIRGIKQSTSLAILFTLIEAGGLIGIIIIGIPRLGAVNYLEMPLGWGGIFQAAALIFFAYQGFEELVKLSDETHEPERTIPLSLLLAIGLSIVLYVAVALSAVSVLGWEALAASPAPFADIARESLGSTASTVFAVTALFATANTVLLILISASRIMYGMARSGTFPPLLAWVHPATRTPIPAILLVTGTGILFLFFGNIGDVASLTNFTIYLTFTLVNASVIVLRFHAPTVKRPFRIPLTVRSIPVLPIFGVLVCLFFLTELEPMVLGAGTLLVVVAIGLSYICCQRTTS